MHFSKIRTPWKTPFPTTEKNRGKKKEEEEKPRQAYIFFLKGISWHLIAQFPCRGSLIHEAHCCVHYRMLDIHSSIHANLIQTTLTFHYELSKVRHSSPINGAAHAAVQVLILTPSFKELEGGQQSPVAGMLDYPWWDNSSILPL